MTSLATIRAKLKEQENKGGSTSTGGDSAMYPFWNMSGGDTAVLRFLPDADTNNDFFWVERAMLKFPFTGIVGNPDSKPVTVQVPCMEMYGQSCAVLNEVRGWFKDPTLEDLGKKYWKKRSYVFQGFVVEDPLKEESPPENPIRRFIIGPQIIKLIKSSMMDPEMDEMPTDYTAGLDFRLVKTDASSGYADYTTSKWARRERALSDAEMNAINTYGLFNLRDSLPKIPNEEDQKAIFEMFEASVAGEAYDEERWGNFYRPYGLDSNRTSKPSTVSAPAPKPVVKEEPQASADTSPPWEESETKETSAPEKDTGSAEPENKAEDILAMIRARQQKA